LTHCVRIELKAYIVGPPSERYAFTLDSISELSHEDMAASCGPPDVNSKSYLMRVKQDIFSAPSERAKHKDMINALTVTFCENISMISHNALGQGFISGNVAGEKGWIDWQWRLGAMLKVRMSPDS
jgi:hypothetical protein